MFCPDQGDGAMVFNFIPVVEQYQNSNTIPEVKVYITLLFSFSLLTTHMWIGLSALGFEMTGAIFAESTNRASNQV